MIPDGQAPSPHGQGPSPHEQAQSPHGASPVTTRAIRLYDGDSDTGTVHESGQASLTADRAGANMAQTHYTSKTKRRPKNSKRKDPSAATMAALRQLEAAAKK